ncbi:MAG: DoxX family membrane protein [Bacteroidales bacterium]|nr:DoxX family membrane protein [Bacteroidales bacterium]MBP5614675.1 DoxX family membrane protein [Bacteroidales bacterium]
MDTRQLRPKAACILRILVGCVFLLSSVSKYLSIDAFDIYLFEHHIFSFNLGSTLSRLLISVEALLGLFLILGIRMRETCMLTWLMLAGFTLYLLFQPLLFNLAEDDCHCFGNWIHLNRWQSIGKNIVLMLMLLPVRPQKRAMHKWQRIAAPVAVAIAVPAFLLVNPPDYIYRQLYGEQGKTDAELYAAVLDNNGWGEGFRQGRQLVCFFSTGCGHCKKAAGKLELMRRFHGWNDGQLRCVFWKTGNEDSEVAAFHRETGLAPLEYATLPPDTFLSIVNGTMPTVLFTENGKIIRSADYVQMDENEMDAFLKGK